MHGNPQATEFAEDCPTQSTLVQSDGAGAGREEEPDGFCCKFRPGHNAWCSLGTVNLTGSWPVGRARVGATGTIRLMACRRGSGRVAGRDDSARPFQLGRSPVPGRDHQPRRLAPLPLSSQALRVVDELLAARGITVSHETMRRWALRFGQGFANQSRRDTQAARRLLRGLLDR